jgi:hypothetical protein
MKIQTTCSLCRTSQTCQIVQSSPAAACRECVALFIAAWAVSDRYDRGHNPTPNGPTNPPAKAAA